MGKRSAAPAPLSIATSGTASSPRQGSFGSDCSDKDKATPTSYSEDWEYGFYYKGSEERPSHQSRKSSSSSNASSKSPTVNRYTHCGRHTDQYLFGGKSVKDMVRNAFSKTG